MYCVFHFEVTKGQLISKEILLSTILPKNELDIVNFYPSLLEQNFFVRFLGELKKPKSPFEINLPLEKYATKKLSYIIKFISIFSSRSESS